VVARPPSLRPTLRSTAAGVFQATNNAQAKSAGRAMVRAMPHTTARPPPPPATHLVIRTPSLRTRPRRHVCLRFTPPAVPAVATCIHPHPLAATAIRTPRRRRPPYLTVLHLILRA